MPSSLLAEYRDAFLVRWALPLSLHLKRSTVEVVTKGLACADFPHSGVLITMEDGSTALFRRAFFVRHHDDRRLVAVFSEHGGYHEFALGPDDTVHGGGA